MSDAHKVSAWLTLLNAPKVTAPPQAIAPKTDAKQIDEWVEELDKARAAPATQHAPPVDDDDSVEIISPPLRVTVSDSDAVDEEEANMDIESEEEEESSQQASASEMDIDSEEESSSPKRGTKRRADEDGDVYLTELGKANDLTKFPVLSHRQRNWFLRDVVDAINKLVVYACAQSNYRKETIAKKIEEIRLCAIHYFIEVAAKDAQDCGMWREWALCLVDEKTELNKKIRALVGTRVLPAQFGQILMDRIVH
jgi:hypothetical protein